MAKSKKSANKSKSNKTKMSVKSEKIQEPEILAKEEKIEDNKKNENTKEYKEVEDKKTVETISNTKVITSETNKKEKKNGSSGVKTFFKALFAQKGDASENILTVFKNKKLYAALLGEIVGTMLLSIVFLTLGVYQPLYMFFILIGATMLTFGLSGANLNPIITAGLMATRRISAIRGVLYMLAQLLGAWLGFLIITGFATSDTATDIPQMKLFTSENFWQYVGVELMGAIIIGFTFARALQYKRSALTFASIIAGGTVIAFIAAIVISSTYLGLDSNFVMNPAIAMMYQILPTGGDDIAQLLAEIGQSLAVYFAFPVIGGIVGFYLSDITSTLNDEKVEM